MKRLALLLPLLLISSCKQDSIGPLNGVLIVYSEDITEFIDSGGLEDIQIVVETVDPENVFSFSYASLPEFTGTLRERRIILMLLSPGDADEFPGGLRETDSGILQGRDIWANNQTVIAATVPPADPTLPTGLQDALLEACNDQMRAYIYRSFVSTSMSSPERIDSLSSLGFTMDVPKSYATRKWMPADGFIQYQRQPDDNSMLLLSIAIISSGGELTPERAMLAREAMARNFFYDAREDSVDRARTTSEPIASSGLNGIQLTGVWRNPEYLNAGSFTTRVLDGGTEWYILDMEVYNPGHAKEPYLREGWIIMNTFHKE